MGKSILKQLSQSRCPLKAISPWLKPKGLTFSYHPRLCRFSYYIQSFQSLQWFPTSEPQTKKIEYMIFIFNINIKKKLSFVIFNKWANLCKIFTILRDKMGIGCKIFFTHEVFLVIFWQYNEKSCWP